MGTMVPKGDDGLNRKLIYPWRFGILTMTLIKQKLVLLLMLVLRKCSNRISHENYRIVDGHQDRLQNIYKLAWQHRPLHLLPHRFSQFCSLTADVYSFAHLAQRSWACMSSL